MSQDRAEKTKFQTLTQKYYKVEFVEDDGDPYKRFFILVNDFFSNHTMMPRSEFQAMALRALMGSCRLRETEVKV
jgi:hypothetical protein